MMSVFDILLLSVIVGTAYMGPMLLRRLPPGHRAFAFMVLVDLGLALLSFASREEGDGNVSRLLGVIAIGGAVFLLVLPPILRDVARRALAGERLRLAKLLVDVRELLQPGMGGKQESELIATIIAVRNGEVDDAVAQLRERRRGAHDPYRRRQFDERIVMTLLYARRWEDAISTFESGFTGDFETTSPQLMVEMVRAYCEAEDLDAAAALMARLEDSSLLREPLLAGLVHRARLVFLAFVGRTGAVEAIVQGPLAAMPDSARYYWSGIARLNAGDKTGARSSLAQAAESSAKDTRAHDIALQLLQRVDEPGVAGPRTVSETVASLADRLTAAAAEAKARPRPAPVVKRRAVVTTALVAANLAVAVAMTLVFSSTADIGGLVRAGANLKEAVHAGEWWRLASSMFLHVGALHLILNMYGLWVLGRLVEPMYGPLRFFSVYMVAGLCGAAASALIGGPETSAGASGAVFGILGAAIAELGLRRNTYPEAWRKRLLGNLLFLTAANVGIGFVITMIDQAAHIGGLLSGGLISALLSPRSKLGQKAAVKVVAWTSAAVSMAFLVYAGVGVATTSFADTLARLPKVQREVGGLELTVPQPWATSSEVAGLQDRSLPLLFFVVRLPADASPEEVVAARVEAEVQGGAKSLGFDRVAVADELAVELPEGWASSELIATVDAEGIGGPQRYRALVFCRKVGDELWFGVSYLPASLTVPLGKQISQVLSSARAKGPLPALPGHEPAEADASAASAE